MSKKHFQHYVFLVISDASITAYNITKFQTYHGFCNHMGHVIKQGKIKSNSLSIMFIIDKLIEVFGFSDEESAIYVFNFFKNSEWETYYKPIKLCRDYFGGFIV